MGSDSARVVNDLPVDHRGIELKGYNDRGGPKNFGLVTTLAR